MTHAEQIIEAQRALAETSERRDAAKAALLQLAATASLAAIACSLAGLEMSAQTAHREALRVRVAISHIA